MGLVCDCLGARHGSWTILVVMLEAVVHEAVDNFGHLVAMDGARLGADLEV